MSKEFFSKTENGTEYRIYLYTFGDGGFPTLIRSALDVADGVHGELVDYINENIDCLNDEVLGLADRIGYEDAKEILSVAARRMAIMKMKNEGWTLCFE